MLCTILNIVTSVQEWKRGKYYNLPMDAFYLVFEIFGTVLCFLCVRLVIRGRKREWQEQEKFVAKRRALKTRV
jgi:hypothetical protein